MPRVMWQLAGAEREGARLLDARLVPLLRAIVARGTLLAAAGDLGVPYRSAWAIVESAHADIGAPLVQRTRGRGATLTSLGEQLLAADDSAATVLRASRAEVDLPRTGLRGPSTPLRIAASHDLALSQLRDRWRASDGIALEFHGSTESLAAYVGGRVDLAGFHVLREPDADDPLLARLRPSRDALLRFLCREQGLILPKGNPRRVRSLRDLGTKRITIVNRQPGSGTRLLFDRLLARERVAPSALAGYSNEEFTHAAVAATIAAGSAQAGFGVRAAAAQLGLAFVPLAEERYFFACRKRALDSAPIVRFRALLASAATRAVVRPLPGCRLDEPGTSQLLPVTPSVG